MKPKFISNFKQISNLKDINPKETATVIKRYPMVISNYFFSLIDPNNPNDPIRKQVVPDIREIQIKSDLSFSDPLAESKKMPVAGLIHRYPDRVVILVSNDCAANCRHCNRKRNWLSENAIANIDECVKYLKHNQKIREVILSGGDPLLLPNKVIKKILESIFSVDSIKVVRIGSRVPVTLPSRIDDEFCEILRSFPAIWLNTQFNHPQEVTEQSKTACRKIQLAGVPINNQSVLLKGINDSPEIIIKLCQKLQEIKVRPYYLFQCDRVEGTEHFWTSIKTGLNIIEKMIGHTGGLCVPRFVIDLPGGEGKIPLLPENVLSKENSTYIFKTYTGKIIEYKDWQKDS